MNVDAIVFERMKLSRDGRVFVRGSENGIARFHFKEESAR